MEYPEFTEEHQQLDSKQKMVKGSIWMTVGSFVSRFMGAIYIIPWYMWMGENAKVANTLFNKGYNIYALFLMISTAGIPGAIAKQISHYNSLNEYKVSKKIFQKTMFVMVGLGVIFSSVMFFSAPILADGNRELIPVMRALSAAILVFPSMSVVRGFFQGYHDMMPSAISQMVEQFVRVLYMLIATYLIMKVGQGDYVSAVTHSTFAAFIGTLGAFATLFWFYQKYGERMAYLEENSRDEIQVSTFGMLKEIVVEAIPFIIIGSAITIVKIFDQYTFERTMSTFTNYSSRQLAELFSLFSANPDKLTMITISIATSISVTGLPLVTEAFTIQDHKGLSKLVGDNIQLFFFVMLPATFGMIIVAEPLNTLFYSYDSLGTALLVEACYTGIILGLYMLFASTLQGLYGNKEAIFYLVIGFAVKVLLQYPFIKHFEVFGPLLTTSIAFLVATLLTANKVHQITGFKINLIARRVLLMAIFTSIMCGIAVLVRKVSYLVLSPTSKGQSFLIVVLVGGIGAYVYTYLVLKVKLADQLLGSRVSKLRDKLHIRSI
ncbi:putative polysaccharide biosynthesis protein [Vagococcus humatus]|uniref:Polysaccharide biosynthesis protein n=1 Tax=Vagococcus humatus TaxID=1889241 RepID=A0A429Z5N6_9ENTE|nr:polysaccharide biosynthesis protein [Vagococcus humatus]RST88998.1 polysaccharide biosynthesis protein [Vagococcus humatus]